MVTDVGRLLDQVVAEVFGADVESTLSVDPRSKYVRRAELRATDG
ncbi:hypothetical protein [Nocardioides immobilis]|nr:hypothetical protein [Nocardioides immobilis]